MAQPADSNRLKSAVGGLLLIVAAGLYRPIVLWADNAWELSSPEKLLLFGCALAALAAIPYTALVRAGVRASSAAVAIAGLVVVVMNWHRLPLLPIVWVGAILAVAGVLQRYGNNEVGRFVVALGIGVLLVAPVAQLVVAHVRERVTYPIADLAERRPAEATGVVEDVLVVIVDGYPSLTVAEEWFGHDTTALRADLDALGYSVEQTAWSQATFTALAVPTLLELGPVVEPGPKGAWGNRMSTYDIIRGDSLVAETLRSAGFTYTHVEGGWDAAACGTADSCGEATWLDEAIWQLLQPSVAADFLSRRYGYPHPLNAQRAVDHIAAMEPALDDGRLDFVFAHVPLPHAPFVVDAECEVVPREVRERSSNEVRVAEQLACADSLISRLAAIPGPNSAVIITADHGTATRGQLSIPGTDWSDGDVAERLGIFLAHRLPQGCEGPTTTVSTDVVRAIMACAVTAELPERDGRLMLGADDPYVVPNERLRDIERLLEAGALGPDS